MSYKSIILTISLVILVFTSGALFAQEKVSIQWLTFEELEQALTDEPKKVFIDFYTDWCTYCRKMDRVVFTKPEVIDHLNQEFYAVRFDAESSSIVEFGGQTFVNDQLRSSRTPVHQIAQLLAMRDGEFVPPTMLVFDENLELIARYFEYLDSRSLLEALEVNP